MPVALRPRSATFRIALASVIAALLVLGSEWKAPLAALDDLVRLDPATGKIIPPGASLPGPGVTPAGVCGDCATPGGALADPTYTCQTISSATEAACPSDFYSVNLVAGERYRFTFCTASCAGATGDYDTRLKLYDPTCAEIANVDDSCGLLSEITMTATVTGTYVVEVTGFTTSSVGNYTLGWLRLCADGDCATPNGALATPTTDCQFQSGTIDCGTSRAYSVPLADNNTYHFTLCPATCPTAGASFDSRIELYRGGLLVASDSSACGDDAEITYTVPGGTGTTFCVKVITQTGATGDFTLGYFVDCRAPIGTTLVPTRGSAAGDDCCREEEFQASTGGTGPFTWTWTVVPPPGGTATPDNGTGTTDSNPFDFTSNLCGAGDYQVSITATNDCGSDTRTITYTLSDRRGPDIACFAEQVACPRPIRAFATAEAAAPAGEPLELHSAAPGGLGAGLPSGPAAPAFRPPLRIDKDEIASVLLSSVTTAEARDVIAAKLGLMPSSVVVYDGRDPALTTPPDAAALACPSPCTAGTLQASNPFYDVFLDCNNGSFTARTGDNHDVTLTSGSKQNVIFGGQFGSPGTSDISFHVHTTGTTYTDPTGGRACAFNPPDTTAEPASMGLEAEWNVSPGAGVQLTLREEIVAFGVTQESSGIRLTLGATNSPTSTFPVRVGVRWQIDYQNAGDDGPLFAAVTCSPFDVGAERSTEHEFLPTEQADFYRIQNNTSSPIFGNFTSSTAIAGFAGTGTYDRFVYGSWGDMVGGAWDRPTNEGDPNPDFDSATYNYYGYLPGGAAFIVPGESFSRSVVIFTAGDAQDCGTFTTGEGTDAELQVCPGDCVRLGADVTDNCSGATVALIDSSPGAPPCSGSPCVVQFPDLGVFSYTWQATDAAGNQTTCSSIVRVEDRDCNEPPTCSAGGPYDAACRQVALGSVTVEDLDDDEISYRWTSDNPLVQVVPDAGTVPAGAGPRPILADAVLDPTVAPCGIVANLVLEVDDGRGGISTCATTVTFNDTEPPTITASPSPSDAERCVWPPNHWYVCFPISAFGASITDSCTDVTYRIEGCASNQPDDAPESGSGYNGDGHTTDDCVISPDGLSVCVRAERCGGGPDAQLGRHYGVAVVAVDGCGNVSAPTIVGGVHVPHDRSPLVEGCVKTTEAGTRELP